MTDFTVEPVGNDFRVIQRPIATGVTEPWQWLTDEEMVECAKYADKQDRREDWYVTFARAVQRKAKEKNT